MRDGTAGEPWRDLLPAIRHWVLAGALVCLAGCAVRGPVPSGPVPPGEQQARLRTLDHWTAQGRIAVRSVHTGGQASLQWEQSREQATIRLSGPFGAGAVAVHWSPERLTVVSREGEVTLDYAGPDGAARLLEDQLGWSFPVASTRYWILGLADPDAPAEVSRDAEGRLVLLDQHGWRIRYDEYRLQASPPDEAALWLPRRLAMESDRGRVRVVVDRWRL